MVNTNEIIERKNGNYVVRYWIIIATSYDLIPVYAPGVYMVKVSCGMQYKAVW